MTAMMAPAVDLRHGWPYPLAMPVKSPLYDRDFYAWSREQAELLRAGKLAEADIEHIAEEIDSMGRTEKRELISRLEVLLLHLLKWRYQPGKRGPSWEASIRVQRYGVEDHLDDNPSLKPLLPQALASAYRKATLEAVAETGLSGRDVPGGVSVDGGAGVGRRVLAGVRGVGITLDEVSAATIRAVARRLQPIPADHAAFVVVVGSAIVSRVVRSRRRDAPSMSKPTTFPAASRSTLRPGATSRVSAPGAALSSM